MSTKRKTSRIMALLLTLCMVFGMLPMTAFAENPPMTPVTKQLSIKKTVTRGGQNSPPAETFEFVLTKPEDGSPASPEDCGISFEELKITTTGTGDFEKAFDVEIDPSKATEEYGWKKVLNQGVGTLLYHQKTFILTEKDDGKAHWTYDTKRYAVTITYYPDGNTRLEVHEPGNDAYTNADFKNTYTFNGIEIPFKKTVTLGGTEDFGRVDFTFEVTSENVNMDTVTVTGNTVTASGAGEWTGIIEIDGNLQNQSEFKITEVYDGADNWTYDETVYNAVVLYENTENVVILKKDMGENAAPVYVDTVEFTNTYTENAEDFMRIPFKKTVTLGGNQEPGSTTFNFDIAPYGNESADISGLTITGNTITTNGKGEYKGTINIVGDFEQINDAEGLRLTEKNDGSANWKYDDTVYIIWPGDSGPILQKDMGENMNPANVDAVEFTNTYTKNSSNGGGGGGTASSYKITASTDAGGVIAPEGTVRVSEGSNKKFEISAKEGYRIADVLVDDKSVGAVEEYTFSNVRADHTIHVVIGKKAELNKEDHFAFMVGYVDGTFGPDRNMTRAEVTTMFSRLLTEQMEPGKQYRSTFNDVPDNYWAASCIGYMQQFGIVAGYTDGSFKPDAPVTRAEFAAIASRFEKLSAGSKSFPDVPDSHWAAKYISFAATRGWVSGYSDGTFRPEQFITRAEVVSVTCRLLERNADQAYIRAHLNELHSFADAKESNWAYWYIMEAANSHDYTRSGDAEQWTKTYK